MRLDTKVKKTHCNADCVNLYNEHLSQQKDMFKRARVTGEGNIIGITFHKNVMLPKRCKLLLSKFSPQMWHLGNLSSFFSET